VKKFIIINGTMGAGKSVVGRRIAELMGRAAFIDGDFVIEMHPYIDHTETFDIQRSNIVHMAKNYSHFEKCDAVILSWIMGEARAAKTISEISELNYHTHHFMLTCSSESLAERCHKDTANDWRTTDNLNMALDMLKDFNKRTDCIFIDTSGLSVDMVAKEIIERVRGGIMRKIKPSSEDGGESMQQNDSVVDVEEHILREHRNKTALPTRGCFVSLISEVASIRVFVDSFSFLQFGRDIKFLLPSSKPIFSNGILMSVEQTLGSLEACCRLGNFSDAHILLRKCRDDLFFYLYIAVASKNQTLAGDTASGNIEKWSNNELDNLHIGEVLKAIGRSKDLAEAVKKYKLQEAFNKIGETLNGFTHAKGMKFYNKPYPHYGDDELQEVCKSIADTLAYLVTVFIFLSALCNPLSIMSTDYVDSLELGQAPPQGSQYWVAPFISEFLEEKKQLLDKNCIDFLQSETGMVFSVT
jgi:broad-specificity NMP kinase